MMTRPKLFSANRRAQEFEKVYRLRRTRANIVAADCPVQNCAAPGRFKV
jgi:hypothetical protein